MLIPQVTPIQPINVIVQQAPGMPAWIIALISALAGGVLGFAGSLAMEYTKPYLTRRTVRKHLNDEFVANLSRVEAASRVLVKAQDSSFTDKSFALLTVDSILSQNKMDRFETYFSTQKNAVYEVDTNQRLIDFYFLLNKRPTDVVGTREHAETLQWLDRIARIGQYYVSETKMEYTPVPNINETVYLRIIEAEEKGREQARH